MTQPDFQKNWAKLDNQKTMTTWEKLLDNTKIWVNQRYGPEFVNASGVIEKRWWLTRFGKVLLDAFVIDFVLSNFIEGISAIAPGDDFDMQYGHLYLLLSFLIGFTVQTGTKTKETLFAITEDDAKKFANSDQYLKSLLNDPKNDYQFIKSEDDEIVKMLNFSDEDNMDSDFAIFKGWDSNFDYVEIKPKEDDESIIDKIGKKIDEL
jgi:hypothetical protein